MDSFGKKMEYIEMICLKLQGLTKLNFQIHLGKVLKEYYTSKGKTYEMPSPNGGDDKNDGWVVEDELFYQIYAPAQLRQSLPKDIRDKFTTDLSELLNKLDSGLWNGSIKEFIFIANTFDDNLPKDSDRFFETTVNRLKRRHGYDFEFKVDNLQYIRRLLIDINDETTFQLILSNLSITMNMPHELVTDKNIFEFLLSLGSNIMDKHISDTIKGDYERISSSKKITLNSLESERGDIEKIIDNLDVVDAAISVLNQDLYSIVMFERIKDFVIDIYNGLSQEYVGAELLNKIYEHVGLVCNQKKIFVVPTKYLVIYIFDHCDIFEKEEDKVDIT